MSKLYKTYNYTTKIEPTTIVARNNSKGVSLFNKKLKEYANESIKKSIKKMDDLYKDPNYKNKLIVAKAFNGKTNDKTNNSDVFKLFAGATTISLSLYLVYSFMKRCGT